MNHPTKCFTFWCRLVWRKNNLNLALTEKQLFLCCVWLSKASIDVVWLPQASVDDFFRPQKCETFGRAVLPILTFLSSLLSSYRSACSTSFWWHWQSSTWCSSSQADSSSSSRPSGSSGRGTTDSSRTSSIQQQGYQWQVRRRNRVQTSLHKTSPADSDRHFVYSSMIDKEKWLPGLKPW